MPTTSKPKYQVVEQNLHVQSSAGEIIIPLQFKTGLYREIAANPDGVLQVAMILTALKRTNDLDKYDDLGVKEAGEIATEFVNALSAYLGADLGE